MFNLDQLDEIAKGIDIRIQNLIDFTGLLKEIAQTLKDLKQQQESRCLTEVLDLKESAAALMESLQQFGLPKADPYERCFNLLRSQITSDEWPLAVDPEKIWQAGPQEKQRAEGIIDLFVTEYLQNLKFLDFGCGSGVTTLTAAERGASLAVGYDIANIAPTAYDNVLLTDDWLTVERNGPYDVVLVYDVLDHLRDDPVVALEKIRNLLSSRGRIYVRNHPWCSRDGSHLYSSFNKAYAHLVFDELELVRLGGHSNMYTNKIYHPVETYRNWFAQAKLEIKSEEIIEETVESYFTDPKQRAAWAKISKPWNGQNPSAFLSVQFADYVLEPDRTHSQFF